MARHGDIQSRHRLAAAHRDGDALLIIDCINDLEFPGGKKVFPWALKLAAKLKAFRAKAHRQGVPVIYVNDKFGMWRPRHSGCFATSFVPLLEHLRIKRLILSGISTNLCVLFTAHDAHMHQYPMVVLSDCCAAESDFDHDLALGRLARFRGAKVCRGTEFHLPILTSKWSRSAHER